MKKVEQLLKARPDFFLPTDDYIKEMAESRNNISYWFPKIENCGIKVPKTVIVPIPVDLTRAIHEDRYSKSSVNSQDMFHWVSGKVMPKIQHLGFLLFVKNGTFSNKFLAYTCMCVNDPYNLTYNIPFIMYHSSILGAGGNTEIAIRERIGHIPEAPTIYCGLPLTTEFRVFYDFDERKVLKTVNYWDYDYCFPHMFNEGDKLIFSHYAPLLQKEFDERKAEVENLVSEHMQNVDLTGKWSVDIMYRGDYWLIDMALAENSAYYKGV